MMTDPKPALRHCFCTKCNERSPDSWEAEFQTWYAKHKGHILHYIGEQND